MSGHVRGVPVCYAFCVALSSDREGYAFLFGTINQSSALPADVRKAYGLPVPVINESGLCPEFMGEAQPPQKTDPKRAALLHIWRQSRDVLYPPRV